MHPRILITSGKWNSFTGVKEVTMELWLPQMAFKLGYVRKCCNLKALWFQNMNADWRLFICNADNRNKQEKPIGEIVNDYRTSTLCLSGNNDNGTNRNNLARITVKYWCYISKKLRIVSQLLARVIYRSHAINKSKWNTSFPQLSKELT